MDEENQAPTEARTTSAWTADHVAAISDMPAIPLITKAAPAIAGLDLWDMWPVQLANGDTARFDGAALWMILSAPCQPDPGARHNLARIRLVSEQGDIWRDYGNVLPERLSPGSREWAGSSVYDPGTGKVTLYFTAAGQRDEADFTYQQRVFETCAVVVQGGGITFENWTLPTESFVSDNETYVRVDQSDGEPGHIKAFRDPAYFCDPADGAEYLLFTGSLKLSQSAFNGAVGIARRVGKTWQLLPPLIHADALNNELERPHMIVRDGLYYLFWSTQRRVFADGQPAGPNGLYGMVATSLFGDYRPLNSTALIAANPASEPLQAYSWWVQSTLEVASFIDHWGMQGRSFDDHPGLLRSQFGGTPAPLFSLALSGDRATIV
jgi:levansucrase